MVTDNATDTNSVFIKEAIQKWVASFKSVTFSDLFY